MTYHYSVLRFVPDPARGETVNLGLIVGDDEGEDWELRIISNLTRARAIDAGSRLPAALAFAGTLEERISSGGEPTREAPPLSIEDLNLMSEEMRNIVQITAPTPIAAESATLALDYLTDELLIDPAARRFRFEKKHRAVVSTRRAYQTHKVPADQVKPRAIVETGPFAHTFDFAVHDGEVVQLVQCWSFQLPNQQELAEQVKAWAWVAHELREHGGTVRVESGPLKVSPSGSADLASVYVPPVDEGESVAFAEAQAAFNEIGVSGYRPEQADEVAKIAAERLGLTT